MICRVEAGPRAGCVRVPSSKSQLHRLLIVAAASDRRCRIRCRGLSRDIEATADCLSLLGAPVDRSRPGELLAGPLGRAEAGCVLPAGESGSTLRFLLPFAGARGVSGRFLLEGNLGKRPLAPLDAQLARHGMRLSRSLEEGKEFLHFEGQLTGGDYELPGNISSQYISGLLMALPLLPQDSRLAVSGRIESSAYIDMTLDALQLADVKIEKDGPVYLIPGGQVPRPPMEMNAEGDWSAAAFFLCMGALSPQGILVEGVSASSHQADRAAAKIVRRMGAEVEERAEGILVRRGELRGAEIDVSQTPDLAPALAALAASAEGCTKITGAARLRLKETDRLQTTTDMLASLGADIRQTEGGLEIRGKKRLFGGFCRASGDHRIAMAAAVAASACEGAVEIEGAECVAKSYPRFFEDLEGLRVIQT